MSTEIVNLVLILCPTLFIGVGIAGQRQVTTHCLLCGFYLRALVGIRQPGDTRVVARVLRR